MRSRYVNTLRQAQGVKVEQEIPLRLRGRWPGIQGLPSGSGGRSTQTQFQFRKQGLAVGRRQVDKIAGQGVGLNGRDAAVRGNDKIAAALQVKEMGNNHRRQCGVQEVLVDCLFRQDRLVAPEELQKVQGNCLLVTHGPGGNSGQGKQQQNRQDHRQSPQQFITGDSQSFHALIFSVRKRNRALPPDSRR